MIILENNNLSGNCLKSLLLWSPSTNQHAFPFFEILIFENLYSKNISKLKKKFIILENINLSGKRHKFFFVVAEYNSAQLFFFRNSHFWKSLLKKYFKVQKSLIIFENINLSGNWHKSRLLYSPNTTQHIFPFFEILILEIFLLFLGDLFFENYLTFALAA